MVRDAKARPASPDTHPSHVHGPPLMIFKPDEPATAPPRPALCLATALLAGACAANAVPASECARLCDLAWMAQASVAEVEAELDATPGAATRANEYDITPLHRAAMANPDPRVADLLIARGARLEARDARGAAFSTRDPEVIERLLAHGAEVNATNRLGQTPLHHAALGNDHPGVTATLLDHGAHLELRAHNTGATPLHAAAAGIALDTLERLLERGADIAARDDAGATALHIAAMGRIPEMAQALIDAGAALESTDAEGRTPLLAALDAGSPTVALRPLRAGADIAATDHAGETARTLFEANRWLHHRWSPRHAAALARLLE